MLILQSLQRVDTKIKDAYIVFIGVDANIKDAIVIIGVDVNIIDANTVIISVAANRQ